MRAVASSATAPSRTRLAVSNGINAVRVSAEIAYGAGRSRLSTMSPSGPTVATRAPASSRPIRSPRRGLAAQAERPRDPPPMTKRCDLLVDVLMAIESRPRRVVPTPRAASRSDSGGAFRFSALRQACRSGALWRVVEITTAAQSPPDWRDPILPIILRLSTQFGIDVIRYWIVMGRQLYNSAGLLHPSAIGAAPWARLPR